MPGRSRHCKRGVSRKPLVNDWEGTGKTTMIRKSGYRSSDFLNHLA